MIKFKPLQGGQTPNGRKWQDNFPAIFERHSLRLISLFILIPSNNNIHRVLDDYIPDPNFPILIIISVSITNNSIGAIIIVYEIRNRPVSKII